MAELFFNPGPVDDVATATPKMISPPAVTVATPQRTAQPMPDGIALLLVTNALVTSIYFALRFTDALQGYRSDPKSLTVDLMSWSWSFGFCATVVSMFLYRGSIARYVALCLYFSPGVLFCAGLFLIAKNAT